MLGVFDSPLDDLATQPCCLVSSLLLTDDDLPLQALCVLSRCLFVLAAALLAIEDASLLGCSAVSFLEWATEKVVASWHSLPFVDVLCSCHVCLSLWLGG